MKPRLVHPVAWWLWAIGMAAAAMRTRNLVLLALIVAVVCYVTLARRIDAPWARAFTLMWRLALLTVLFTVVLQIVLGIRYPGTVLLRLPGTTLPDWSGGIALGGDVTAEALLAALTNGLRLAAIIVCFGSANALAHPTRLLRVVPAALYELGVAAVVAITFVPQLAESTVRIRQAQRLRGRPITGLRGLRGLLVPVLEESLERAIALAASMDSRGYGRRGDVGRAFRALTGAAVLVGLIGACFGTYTVIDSAADRTVGVVALAGGTAVAAAGALIAGRRTQRTSLRKDPWGWPEWLTAGSGIAVAVAYRIAVPNDVNAGYELEWPHAPVSAVLLTVVGVLAGVLTPRPPLPGARATRSPERQLAGTG
ncbi:MAG: energy-coupling factor transporter transrane protein EcfT [Pseudonocardiales bacterium]|nr:energy-coupling factor transporter transrane protein EcfT [Pseudonocardiales bacterium]